MAVTRLKRKHRKNIARANNKQRVIKQLLSTPVIKNVDVEELKAQFNTTSGSAKSEKTAAAVAPEATADTNTGGILSSVRGAIADAAQTVVDKVEDVVEAVKDRVAPDNDESKAAE